MASSQEMIFPQEITLDLNSNTAYTTVGVKQGDAYTRDIIAHITANGIDWNIPSGVVASYRIRKPDGMAVWNNATIDNSNNTVIITLTEESLAVAGRAYADIVFYTNSGRAQILSTVSFIIIIMSSPNISKEIASTNEFSYIQQIVDDANVVLTESEAWATGTKKGIPVVAPEFSSEKTAGSGFTYELNENTFRNYIRETAGTQVEIDAGETTVWLLKYEGTGKGWYLQTGDMEPISIDPSNIGLSVTGTPITGSTIAVTVTENDIQWRNNSKYWADRARISKESIENLTVKVTKTLAAGASASVSSTSVEMVTKGSCTTGYSGITVNKTTFGNKVDHEIRDYKFSYNSGWKLDGKPVTLSAYGISNTPSQSKIGDYFTVTYNAHRSLGFQLPCGPTGPAGVSSVTASAEQLGAGASPAVSVSLSSAKLHFNFGIPAAQGQGAASVDGEVPSGTSRDIKLDAVRAIQSQALTTKQKGYVRDTLGVVPTTFKINGVTLGTVSISLTPTNIGAVPTSRTINGKTLDNNITLTASNVSAIPTTFKINGVTLGSGSSTSLTPANIGAVPTTFKINGITLGASSTSLTPANIGAVPTTFKINGVTLGATSTSLTAANVGAVPTSRTINGKALSGNLVLNTVFANVTVASASWASNTAYSAAGFGYRAKVSGLTGVTADMIPSVVFSLTDSMSGIYAPIAETTTNGVYIYASEKPTAQITIPTIVCIAK